MLEGLVLHSLIAGSGTPLAPECPWDIGAVRWLQPVERVNPSNASFWIVDYAGDAAPSIVDETTSSSVAVDEIVVELMSTGGRLIQLRPRAVLRPGVSYSVHAAADFLGRIGPSILGRIGTSTVVDDTAPAVPNVTGAGAFTGSYDGGCRASGVTVGISPPDTSILYVYEDPATGAALEVGFGHPRVFGGFIPAPTGELVRLRVVAIDFAGNRSPPSRALEARAGAMVSTIGGRQVPHEGCETAGSTPIGGLAVLAVLALARRRVRLAR